MTWRYDVAKFLNMKEYDPNLAIILQNLHSDDDWNQEDPLQKGFYLAHLKRYDLFSLRKSYKELSDSEHETEVLTG